MKDLKRIESMSAEMLEDISQDKSIEVPSGLRARLEKSLPSGKKDRKYLWIAALAASAALVFTIGVNYYDMHRLPKDSFTDPALAYAQLEKTFNHISDRINVGMSINTNRK